jgi:transketolase C-terminal domain/subunit
LPLDIDLIRTSINKTGRVLVIEEHTRSGGLGDDVLRGTRDMEGIKYAFINIPDTFVTGYGSVVTLCASLGLNAEGIVSTVQREFGMKPGKKAGKKTND